MSCMNIAMGFWAFGWALAYGVDPTDESNFNPYIGTGEFFLIGGFDYSIWMFQFSFAATAATIDSGAVAERMNFRPYILFSFVTTSFIQPVVCHWCWSQHGYFTKLGFHDFAGSGPVHLVGGAMALVAAWFVGPRTGRFSKPGISRVCLHMCVSMLLARVRVYACRCIQAHTFKQMWWASCSSRCCRGRIFASIERPAIKLQ